MTNDPSLVQRACVVPWMIQVLRDPNIGAEVQDASMTSEYSRRTPGRDRNWNSDAPELPVQFLLAEQQRRGPAVGAVVGVVGEVAAGD